MASSVKRVSGSMDSRQQLVDFSLGKYSSTNVDSSSSDHLSSYGIGGGYSAQDSWYSGSGSYDCSYGNGSYGFSNYDSYGSNSFYDYGNDYNSSMFDNSNSNDTGSYFFPNYLADGTLGSTGCTTVETHDWVIQPGAQHATDDTTNTADTGTNHRPTHGLTRRPPATHYLPPAALCLPPCCLPACMPAHPPACLPAACLPHFPL